MGQLSPAIENAQIADLLDEIADLLELTKGDLFRIRAYRGAARTVRDYSKRVQDIVKEGFKLSKLPNIGKSTAEKIGEIVTSGTCRRLEQLRKKVPRGLATLMKVPGLGPQRARLIYDKLKITTLEALRAACAEHKLSKIRTLGEKTEENILKGLETVTSGAKRVLLKAASDQVESLGGYLSGSSHIQHWEVAGSYRRQNATVGDLDVLIKADNREAATKYVLDFPSIKEVIARGGERLSVKLAGGLQVDFRFFKRESFGAALMYFTGSKAHNVALRKIAQRHKWKLNEYGLFRGKHLLAGATEAEIYERLGMADIPPELREDRGEIEAALKYKLPSLVESSELRGDLHCHTRASDGVSTIQDMASAAQELGYEYLAITDHSKSLTIAHGLNEAEIKRHAEKIRAYNTDNKGLWLMAGVEVDILKNGELDLDAKTLSSLDWVVASVHSHFGLGKKEMTERLIRAVKSKVIHCLGHPLGRMIGHREAVDLDFDRLFAACRENNVRLEINAQPDRLDLPDNYCQMARDGGVKFVISTDAHKDIDLQFMRFGLAVARRGWLTKSDILNTAPANELRQILKKGK